jgi:hypothetical protein
MKYLILVTSIVLVACSQAKVRSTVDSYGVEPLRRDQPFFFRINPSKLLEQQAIEECKRAVIDLSLKVSNDQCSDCVNVALHVRMAGTQQVIRASPGFGSSWGIFGANGGAGVSVAAQATSSQEAGREISLQFFSKSATEKPLREIQVRSVGRENSVSAVAYEMCKAAFQDYPQNLEGRFYEIAPNKRIEK